MELRNKYKKLGNYIREVDVRNKGLKVSKLLGVSNEKYFIPSIANIVGTDLSNYKIVKRNQFAFGTVTSRNGDKLSIAILKEDECIVSSSYIVFEVIDDSILNPDYLMMWLRREEFDRYARFMSHGSVRELFGWDKLCDVELPIPEIDEQLKYVNDYDSIQNAIKIKEAINNNLLEQIDTLFSNIFGNIFDKSNNLEIVGNLGKTICGKTPLTDIAEYYGGEIPFITIPDMHNNTYILFTERTLSKQGANSQKSKYIPAGSICISCIASSGLVSIATKESQTNQQINTIIPNNKYSTFFIYSLMRQMSNVIKRKGEGGTATLNLNKANFEKIEFRKPSNSELELFEKNNLILQSILTNQLEILHLNSLKQLIISKLSKQ